MQLLPKIPYTGLWRILSPAWSSGCRFGLTPRRAQSPAKKSLEFGHGASYGLADVSARIVSGSTSTVPPDTRLVSSV